MTKGNEYFRVVPQPEGGTKRVLTIAQKTYRQKPPKFIVERRSLALRDQPWQPALNAYTHTQGEAYRVLEISRQSPLRSYWRNHFRVRRLSDDKIMREVHHKSC